MLVWDVHVSRITSSAVAEGWKTKVMIAMSDDSATR